MAVSRPRILVARSIPTTSTPVAIGSSVPAWPTLRVPKMRLQRPTTSWLVMPAGLSTTTSRLEAVRLTHSTIAVSARPSRTDQRPDKRLSAAARTRRPDR